MNTKSHLLIFIISMMFIFSSCVSTSLLDEKIDPTTLSDVISKIKKEMPDLDIEKAEVLKKLETINKGREAFMTANSGSVIEPEKFNMYKEQLFNYFVSNETSYKELFEEIETMKNFDNQYGATLTGIYQEIDAFCVSMQNEVNDKERQVQQTINKLSKSINVNILSINKSRYFQHQSVEVLTQITNKTKAPIEAIDFNLYISKNGKVIAKLPIHMDDRFVSNKMKKFSYTSESHPSIFNALKNIDVYSITLKEEVYKMNHDGNIIDAYAIMRGVKNYEYKTASILKGECPYLKTNDELYAQLQEMLETKEKELANATPNLEKIAYITESLIRNQS